MGKTVLRDEWGHRFCDALERAVKICDQGIHIFPAKRVKGRRLARFFLRADLDPERFIQADYTVDLDQLVAALEKMCIQFQREIRSERSKNERRRSKKNDRGSKD